MAGQLENDADVALSKLSPEKLLLCGLQLLSKINASNVSLAAVQPRLQSKLEILNPGSPPLSSTLLREPQNTPPSSPEEHQSVPQSDPANGRKRKRRGDNSELSVNERREKRRLMNRVAAQNARDRKKVYVDDLERRVAELEAKNAKLQQENQSLRQRTATLEAEKYQLETQLHHEPSTHPFVTGTYSSTLGSEQLLESGSAVPSTSLQQKQILKALFAQVLVIVSLIHWLTSCKTVGPSMTSPPVHHMMQWLTQGASHMTFTNHKEPLRKPVWWGAKQSTWNPLANKFLMLSRDPLTP
jgi:hypothetical protein